MAAATARRRFEVEGMDCPSCALKIETALKRLPGVGEVGVNVGAGTVTVHGPAEASAVAAAIAKLGYRVGDDRASATGRAHDHDHDHDHAHGHAAEPGLAWWRTAKGRLVVGAGILLVLAWLAERLVPALGPWPFVLATLVAAAPVARRAVAAALAGSPFTIEMLMVIAAAGALLIDAAEEAAVVVFLFAVGELLEGMAAGRARRSIEALGALAPKTARLVEGEAIREVAADSLRIGQTVLVRPGDRIPGDGRIAQGRSDVDEAPVTGESAPRAKAPGDEVFAGSVNLSGALHVEISRAATDNTIARIVRLVEEAQEAKAPVQRFVDRFARIYMPFVVGLALLVALLPPLLAGGDWAVWTYRALALLLIACPCALVISTPAAIAAGLAVGARQGLLIKGGATLEALAGLRTIAFDKTGTLTEGRPAVTDILPQAADETAVLRLAAGLEAGSSHPIAQAVLRRAADAGIAAPPATDLRILPGQGIAGRVDGRELRLVSPRGRDLGLARAAVERLEGEGKTVAVLEGPDGVQGLLAVRDEPRDDAAAGLARLRGLGIAGIMLTGDNRRTAEAVAAGLGIEARAELLPEDKARIVGELAAQGRGPVGKVGDGINDAPALAAASVGIAMGGGTEVALETADAALLRNRVTGVALLVELARATLANVRQNIALALGLKAVFLVTTVLGMTGLWIAVMADTGATVLVTLNALRLLRLRLG